jgi:hypothetical protein
MSRFRFFQPRHALCVASLYFIRVGHLMLRHLRKRVGSACCHRLRSTFASRLTLPLTIESRRAAKLGRLAQGVVTAVTTSLCAKLTYGILLPRLLFESFAGAMPILAHSFSVVAESQRVVCRLKQRDGCHTKAIDQNRGRIGSVSAGRVVAAFTCARIHHFTHAAQ